MAFTSKSDLSKGANTEFCSEALGQICLAWAIKGNRSLTIGDLVNAPLSQQTKVGGKWDNFSDNGGLNMNTIRAVSGLCVWADGNSTWTPARRSLFADYISRPLTPARQQSSNNPNWVEAQFRYMLFVRSHYGLIRGFKIINDKVLQRMTRVDGVNPYSALMSTGVNATMMDKWNPADIWCVNREGVAAMRRLNQKLSRRSRPSIEVVNQFMANQYNKKNIIPLSLKKPRGMVNPHLDVVNSGEFIQTIALGKSAGGLNDTIEFNSDLSRGHPNQDMKINFTIQTLQLPEGKRGLKEAARARRGQVISGGTVVQGSQKHIRLKYHVNNKKLELEFTQTGGDSYAAAKMGNIGAENFQRIINGTSRAGVSKLNAIQRQQKYQDIDINTSPWFNGGQLQIGSLSSANRERNNNRVRPHVEVLEEYLDEIWKEINGSNMTQQDKQRYRSELPMYTWSKARAGEVGLAVGGINNRAAQRRVVQNLYELAASIADVVGLSARDMGSDFMNISSMKTAFRSSTYVKVY